MKSVLILVLCAVVGGAIFAQETRQIEPPFVPRHPIVMGQGGSFTANAQGYNSFFLNPAGFRKGNELSVLSINPWLYSTSELLEWIGDPENPLVSAVGGQAEIMRVGTKALSAEQQTLVDSYLSDAGIDLDISNVDWSTITVPDAVTTVTNASAGATVEDLIVSLSEGTLAVDQTALETEYPDIDFNAMSTEAFTEFTDAIISDIASEMVVQVAEQALDLPPGFLRVGANVGVSVISEGVGVGVFALAAGDFHGNTVLSTTGRVQATGAAIAGYAHTLSLGGMELHLGADIRPMVKFKLPLVAGDVISDLIGGEMISPAYILDSPGFVASTIGFDLGAILDLGAFSIGLSVKDFLNTKYNWYPTNLSTLASEMSLPGGEPIFESITPMSVNIGASFHPDFGRLSILLDPRFHVDLRNIAFVPEYYENFNALELLNFGAEITALKFLTARAGFAGGYFTAGVGAHLLFLDANIAAVVDATSIDEVSDFGVSAEIAFRF